MRLFFEREEFDLENPDANIPKGSQALETVGIIRSWQNGTETYTINTSGTTGEYKSIILPRRLLEWSARQTALACRLRKKEREYCGLPINKIGGMMQIIRSVIFDRDLQVVDPTADPMSKLDDKHPYTLTSLTPYQFFHISQNEDSLNKLARFNVVLLGGGPIEDELENKICDFEKWVPTKFYHTYGMTETASHVALRRIGHETKSNRFKPLPGVIIEQDNDYCMRILIPDLRMIIQTHDIIDLTRKGFSFVGRKDNIINSGGLKIIPEQLESSLTKALNKQGIQIPFYFKGEPDEALGQKCVLVMLEKDRPHLNTLKQLIEHSIEPYQRPKSVSFRPDFKYTKTNKLIRR